LAITTRGPHRKTRRGRRPIGRRPAATPSTRAQILEAAFRTLVDVGYGRISMRKIAERARVNQALLHYYYGSKERLMLEVLDYVDERLLTRQREMYTAARTFEQIWARALEFLMEDIDSGYVRALWELRGEGLGNKRIEQRLTEIIGRWRNLVADLARHALAEYGITKHPDPVILGRIMGDLYWGAEAEILAGEDPRIHFEAIRFLGNLFRWMANDERAARPRREPSP
jgi:AcrR family transcriptional regulator